MVCMKKPGMVGPDKPRNMVKDRPGVGYESTAGGVQCVNPSFSIACSIIVNSIPTVAGPITNCGRENV